MANLIEVHVAELRQLFNAIDPAPFHERDLDPAAEDFILEWARELPRNEPLEMLVHLDRCAGLADEPAVLTSAVHQFFEGRRISVRRQFAQLMHRGRVSLVIGLAFLVVALLASNSVSDWLPESRLAAVVQESLLIGGWVAMWRPLEIFLYDWWPVRAEERLLGRLATMPVRINYEDSRRDDAWRHDWPAAVARAAGR